MQNLFASLVLYDNMRSISENMDSLCKLSQNTPKMTQLDIYQLKEKAP